MLSFCKRTVSETDRKRETLFLYFVSFISLSGRIELFSSPFVLKKTRNCLFFVLLRGFLTLATLFGSYIFLLFVSVMEQCDAHFYR